MNIERAVAKLFSAKLGAQIAGFLALMFFTRELTAHQLGVFFLFQAVLSILIIPSDFGVREGVEKRISEGTDPSAILTTGFVLKLAFTALIIIGLILTRHWVNSYIGGEVTFLLALGLVLTALAELMNRTLKGELRVGETASIELARQLTWVGVGVAFVWLQLGYRGLIYSLLLGLGVAFIWGNYKRNTDYGSFSQNHARSLLGYSKYSFISSVGGQLYIWTDVLLIGFFLSQGQVSAYEMSWRIAAIVTLLSSNIAVAVFPQVSEWDAQDNQKQIESLLPNVYTASLFLVVPALFGSALLSRELLGLLFGEAYTMASNVLVVLMIMNIVQVFNEITARTLRAINQPRLVAIARILNICVNLTLNIIFIWQFGLIGAAIATGVALTVDSVLVFTYLNRFISVKFPYKDLGWFVVASTGMAVVVGIVKQLYQINSLPELFGIVGLGAVVYAIMVLGSPSIRFRLRELYAGFTN